MQFKKEQTNQVHGLGTPLRAKYIKKARRKTSLETDVATGGTVLRILTENMRL
jgi:hypothetical protein